jgi:hypothetical protein
MLMSNTCAVLGKSFKMLQPHLAHTLVGKLDDMSRVNAAATVAPIILKNGKVNTTYVSQGTNHCYFPKLR